MAAEIPRADRDVFLEELARYPGDTVGSVVTASPNPSRLMLSPHIWRQRLYNLIQTIIDPEPLTWMDDDDAPFIPDLCRRSLDEIRVRFEQCVILSLSGPMTAR
jgi:hypothetical protein